MQSFSHSKIILPREKASTIHGYQKCGTCAFNERSPKHLWKGTAWMKYGKETEEGEKHEYMDRSTEETKKKSVHHNCSSGLLSLWGCYSLKPKNELPIKWIINKK